MVKFLLFLLIVSSLTHRATAQALPDAPSVRLRQSAFHPARNLVHFSPAVRSYRLVEVDARPVKPHSSVSLPLPGPVNFGMKVADCSSSLGISCALVHFHHREAARMFNVLDASDLEQNVLGSLAGKF